MAAHEHLNKKLFHGGWGLEPGDIVSPEYAKTWSGPGDEHSRAFATDDYGIASMYGAVNLVEPVDPCDLEPYHDENEVDEETGKPWYTMYASRKGFRVLKSEI